MTETQNRANPSAETDPARPEGRRTGSPIEASWQGADGVGEFMTGTRALSRVLICQRQADEAAGRRTGGFVSGYPGSPLSAVDAEFARRRDLDELRIVHQPGLNEDLAATAVGGTQLVNSLPGGTVDGVAALWFAKAPGLDRSVDALRHANFIGTAPLGGVLLAVGDDPASKTSAMPCASEAQLEALGIPVFYPGTVQEIFDLGMHALACSRAAGVWVGLKLVAPVSDAATYVDARPDRIQPVQVQATWQGRPYTHDPNWDFLRISRTMEQTLREARLPAVLDYARRNNLNPVVVDAPEATVGLVAGGKTYQDLRQALGALGADDQWLAAHGVRLLKLGMVSPLDEQALAEFAAGLDRILVVEEKEPRIERALRNALFEERRGQQIMGKKGPSGAELLSGIGELDADAVRKALCTALPDLFTEPAPAQPAPRRHLPLFVADGAARAPFFCSGCPHNISTRAPEGALVGMGIGCHGMAGVQRDGRGIPSSISQMGGEGAQWLGMAPFTEDRHLIQNVGDGTFHHSGSLAVRAAVAAGVNITFKLLYNQAVAMTGAQPVAGVMSVPDITRMLEAEGVRRTIVTTDEPRRYRRVRLARNAEVRDRSEILQAQEELAKLDGVTVLIHDQQCAAEKRRLRKRGKAPVAEKKIHINERVCDGCGDCGRKSSCMSVLPVQTEFGRKTQIDQSTCNSDFSCLQGDCPSFLSIVPGTVTATELPEPPTTPEPSRAAVPFTMRMTGIGGTGVITANQILVLAASRDGLQAQGIDQTGLAQKGGPVTSDLRIADAAPVPSSPLGDGEADLYLCFDLIGAAMPGNLRVLAEDRTRALISTSEHPTPDQIVDVGRDSFDMAAAAQALAARTLASGTHVLDAQQVVSTVLGDHTATNIFMLGMASQHGFLPVSPEAIEWAITQNGVAVERNLAAFRWGRAAAHRPESLPGAADQGRHYDHPGVDALLEWCTEDLELHAALRLRAVELVGYQSLRYATRYIDQVRQLWHAERARGAEAVLTATVARQLFKLMAYKDEYEVARLHFDPVELERIRRTYGADAVVRYQLHPPALRALGMKNKLELGPWFAPMLKALRHGRRLRGTRLDPFGYAHVRRVERALIDEYCAVIALVIEHLGSADPQVLAALCQAPDEIRGYEEVKLAGVERFRRTVAELTPRLTAGPAAGTAAAAPAEPKDGA